MRRVRVPYYVVPLLGALAMVGGITTLAAVGSYSRMLWKVTNYNSLRRDKEDLKKQNSQLQSAVKESTQQLASLQSLASDVAVTYGINHLQETPFSLQEASATGGDTFQQSLEQLNFLERNATVVSAASQGMTLLPGPQMGYSDIVPSVWPVLGQITGKFGERMDPFSGEGAWHSGVDIASHYGDEVRAAADGVVIVAEDRAGYGRLVVIDHGFGLTTWYGHLSAFDTQPGLQVKRGDVIGLEGQSGRSTGPHVHYEVRIYNTPVNPWRYLKSSSAAD